MIGLLPKSLCVNGNDYAIDGDYRTALLIFQAFSDPELNDIEKAIVAVECLYDEPISEEDMQEAIQKAYWFLDGGNMPKENTQSAKTLDWEQDESIIFPAVNKVAGYEIRAVEFLHWWTFLGLFNEIGEGLFSTVISIRAKQNKGKKLEKHEKEFLREHKALITLKEKKTAQQIADDKSDEELIKKIMQGGDD